MPETRKTYRLRVYFAFFTQVLSVLKNPVTGFQEGHIELKAYIEKLKRDREELRGYCRRITRDREEDRMRLAYALSDNVAQYLSIFKLHLDALLDSGAVPDPEALDKFRCQEKDLVLAIEELQRYSRELWPSVLDHLGLQAAMEHLAGEVNKSRLVSLELKAEGREPELSPEVKLGFFRIAQEAVDNICRHSGASRAVIQIKFEKARLRLSISDKGTGFDIGNAAGSGKKCAPGLMSMQESARSIGAGLKIESKPGKGTVIRVVARLKPPLIADPCSDEAE